MSEAQNGGNVMENVNCLRCRFRHEDNGNCTAVGGFCTAAPAAHCPLLCQYLDTGMTPEAFQSFVVFFQDLIGNQKASEALDRFRQLVKADKDGRLVMPPCKVGDTVWAASGKIIKCEIDEMYLCDSGGIEFLVSFNCDGADCKRCPFNNWTQDCSGECYCDCEYGNGSFKDSDIGKTIFLTSEEAKAALEAMKDGNG